MRIDDFRIFENLQRARKILSDNKVAETDPRFIELRKMLQRNAGYVGQFTKWMIENRKSIEELKSLYDRLRANRIDKPIEGFDRPEDLIDYIVSKNSQKDISEIYAEMTRSVKEMVEEYDGEIRGFITNNLQHKDIIKNFIARKASRYDDGYEFLKALEKEIDDMSNWDEKFENLKKDEHVVYKDDEIIILMADNYSVMVDYGSRYWCITEDEYTFNEYSENGFQLIIFFIQKSPTDNDSMMGLTVDQDGLISNSKSPISHIYTARWRNDDEVTEKEQRDIISKYPVLGKSDLLRSLVLKAAMSRLEDETFRVDDLPIFFNLIKKEKDIEKSYQMISNLFSKIVDSNVFDSSELDSEQWAFFFKRLKESDISIYLMKLLRL
jgi:hypothetical protein